MFCNQCGSNIKDSANFCKYCGAKVKKNEQAAAASKTNPKPSSPSVEPPRFITKEESLFSQAVMSDDSLMNQIKSPSGDPSISEYDPFLSEVNEKFDPITDDVIDILYSREREVDIKEEIKELLEEVKKIEQRLNIGLISKDEAADQITEKQNLMNALKSERKSLKTDKITIEILESDIKELQDKLDKLHIMNSQGKISHESVYDKLKAEYNSSLSTKQSEFEQQKVNVRNWLKVLELDVQKMKEDIDMTNAKVDLGEVSKEEAQSKESELEIDIYRKELAYHSLKAVQEKLTSQS